MLTGITTKRYDDHIAIFMHNLYIGCYHESVTLESVLEGILEGIRDDI